MGIKTSQSFLELNGIMILFAYANDIIILNNTQRGR